MATKPEAAAPAPAPQAAAQAPSAEARPSAIKSLMPVILVVVLAPVVSWAVAQFVILPQFEKKLSKIVAAPAAEAGAAAEPAAAATEGGGESHEGKKGAAGAANSYEFANVIVNLSGTMGTRYLKTTFKVVGKDNTLRATFESNKDKLLDVTLNVLSSLSLADLEEVGAKNIIREKLINSYNQALGKKTADQVYFTDFVVQ
ncbi:MAG TPA: flagellar basal body-associated FliL family protein [Opitutaceae bacterium]|nr:flagellar basal body-associated FliL family protein [Opitutaceae bacterium]HQL22644.1 flagellar basal body-associated FliL family protein [Opitutaceae bacterium]